MPTVTLDRPFTGWPSAWAPPPELPIDEWAEQSVVLPRAVSAEPGPLNLDRTPYLREILRACQDPDVEEIDLMFSTQVGKTLACILLNLHSADQDPWPCLHVSPTEDDARAINTDRYQRIILESPVLRAHLTGAAHDMTQDAIRLNGAVISFEGANSPSGLASRAIRNLVLDETDKYPPFAGREADPIELAMERTRTFAIRKSLKASTPTTEHGYIYRDYQASDRRRFWVPCPHCRAYQILVMGSAEPGSPGIHWPKDVPAEAILDHRLAWYECAGCHQRILDLDKPGMLRDGVWCPEAQHVLPDGTLAGDPPPRRHLGYHLSALYSPWLTWSAIARKFLASKGSEAKLMNFRNSWLAEVWQDRVEELTAPHLRARQQDYAQGEVPRGAHVLTAGVDVQVDHLWYVIRGWGDWGESWLVRCGRVESWEALARVVFAAQYLVPGGSGEPVRLGMCMIDAAYRSDEVYPFCRRVGAQAIRGDAAPKRAYYATKHQHADGTTSPLVMIDTGYYKGKLHRLTRTRDEDPGAWHLPRDLDEEYFSHLVAEQRVKRQDKRTGQVIFRWELTSPGTPNHLMDCEVYALVAADILDVEHRGAGRAREEIPAPSRSAIVDAAPREMRQEPRVKKGRRRILPTRSRFFSR